MSQANRWYKLDNAATIVPSTAHGSNTRVFRIACELREDVNPDLLQRALDRTLIEYPHLCVVLRKGFFWYYLDSTDQKPEVTKDGLPACAPLWFPGRRSLLFRVTYYHKRINLEMFHVLADGTGGFMFFRELIMNYLGNVHDIPVPDSVKPSSSATEKKDDAFRQYYTRGKSASQLKSMTSTRAYQIHQYKDDNMQNHLIEGTVSAKAFIELAHRYHTTAGVLSTSLYILAVIQSMSMGEREKFPIIVSVPVNLRQYFPSETTRNFFGVINITYNAGDYNGELSSILNPVAASFAAQLTKENIRNTMNGYSALEHNLAARLVPLFLKDLGIEFFSFLAQRGTTATVSNLGVIRMPEEFTPYIEKFSSFMATPNMQVCISSFQDNMVFGFVSAYQEHAVCLNFFRALTDLGLEVNLATNDYDTPLPTDRKERRKAQRAQKEAR